MTIISIIMLIMGLIWLLPMVVWVSRYGLIGAFERLALTMEAIWIRLAHGPSPAPVEVPAPTTPRLNETELLSPIEDMVATIERRLEHEAGQCGNDCRQCSLERCTDCERVSIFAMGIEEPVKTAITARCPKHQ